jgi:chromosome segregation ATPase|tara:strand:+ start:65 stop:556 length:492 start_codon:yes stop_codon:yes gene_type:complete
MVLGGAGSLYYKSTQATIMELTQYNATLTSQVDQIAQVNEKNLATIADMQANFERQRQQYDELQQSFTVIRNQKNELQQRLGSHDLGALAVAKPALVERVVNRASAKAFRCFELETGAELTDNERNATNAQTFNSECPWIYDDLVSRGMLSTEPSGTPSEGSD